MSSSHMPSAPPAVTRRVRSIVVPVLALVLYALLVDAAIETYASVSDLRLYVAVPVALYISFTLWLLRQHRANRPGAETSAWLSAFLFLGLLAFTATMPGGLDSGMRVATLSTSMLMTVASLAVLLMAGVTLVVDSPLAAWLRGVVAVAVAYGVAALVLGLVAHQSYVRLLHGGSWWKPLPYYLQGAFIGGMVVLPFALVVEVGVAMARVKVRGRMHRIVAYALGFVIACSAFTSAW